MNIRFLFSALLALILCYGSSSAQQQEEPVARPDWEPSKYRISKSHLLPLQRGPQAGVSRGRFIINFGSREGVQPGSIFRVMNRGQLMALIRIHHAWRDSAEARVVRLIHKTDQESPFAPEPGYYLEPKLVLLETIQFEKGEPVITPEMYERLHYVARFIRSYPQFPLMLEGHTDNAGDRAKNKKLGQERAEGVLLFLNEVYRLPKRQMHAISYGEDQPVATNSTTEGRYRNRRVDIVLVHELPNKP